MAASMRDVDPAFQHGVVHQDGLEIWKIDHSCPVPLPRPQYGKFCTNRAYIILKTCTLRTQAIQHTIHYWLGRSTSPDEAAAAAIKSVELNAALGGRVPQVRELEGYESDKFLSSFKPCLIPLQEDARADGVVEHNHQQPRMFLCKGRHVVRVKEVPFTRSSLTHDNVFVVDTERKIFQFNGANTDIYERAKALDVVQYLMQNFHKAKCHVAIIEDGKFVADVDSGEFWSLYGGFAPLSRKMENGKHQSDRTESTLFMVREDHTDALRASPLQKSMLDTNKSFILKSENEVFTWMGQDTSLEERKTAILVAQKVSAKHSNPEEIKLFSINEGFEPVEFRSKFDSWPISSTSSGHEGSGRERATVLLKQKGFNVKGILKPAPTKETTQLISTAGELQAWRVEGSSKQSLPETEHGTFHNTSCYVVLHSFTLDHIQSHFIYLWLGHESTMESRDTAEHNVKDIAGSFQGTAVEVRIYEGKEPDHFFSLFDKVFLTKDTGAKKEVGLFQVHQSAPSKWRAIQVSLVAASLNSSSCFFLQTGESFLIWYGKFTTLEEQEATKKMVYHLKNDAKLSMLKEGAETEFFWNILGGKQFYSSDHEPKQRAGEPRLFSCDLINDQLKATQVFNFTQEDLLSDEIMILDCFTSVFVWIGETSSSENKLRALEFGQKYLELAIKHEGNCLETPVYLIHEGHEPLLFTSLFEWDSTKLKYYIDAFQRKLSTIKGEETNATEVQKDRKMYPISNGKGFQQVMIDRARSSPKVAFKPEHSMNKLRQSKGKTGQGYTPSKSTAVSALSTMFDFQKGREPPPNTPIVKLSPLSLKPKETRIKVSPPPTPSTRTTPKTSISPAIASLTTVYESYNDRFAFAWPGMKLRHEERALSRDVDIFSYGTITETGMDRQEEPPDKGPQQDTAERTPADIKLRHGFYSYERLKVSSSNPVKHIDSSKRESYLSNEEFQTTFLMDKDTFYKLPRWKQDKYKVLLDLF